MRGVTGVGAASAVNAGRSFLIYAARAANQMGAMRRRVQRTVESSKTENTEKETGKVFRPSLSV